MNPRLEVKYLRLEKSRNQLLDELEGLDDDLLNTPATEAKWSINQVLSHLLQVEQFTVSYIQRKIQKEEELEASLFSNTVKTALVKLALLSPFKFKAPAVVATVPDKANFSSLRHQWNETRYKLEDLLTDLPDTFQNKYLFKHPIAGPMTVQQTLSFLHDHFHHHLPQIINQKQKLSR
ncbi:DinB family protein [Pontibacter sp. SGAir0037]|uniref:DinB family protein n=1 Tax=Pontibacter sp. SGAir0037 TaxID=2571030 RepID=UPI0010CD52A6|nr:DinB family protein [Pontibacter sp. SGAir0037]QCR25004.1 DinB family protein [Pontibacter sp. SGAir0037]